ncbi:MAG: threonine--tRNA ligase [Candidatus Dojkabacteria bacterium]
MSAKKDISNVPEIEKMRHTASHVLAQAILKLYPDTKLGIGPAIENGFYYDFEFSEPITEEDLPKIEKEMQKIVDANLPLEQVKIKRDAVIERYEGLEQEYKLDLLNDIPDKEVSFYITGQDQFIDMCRGPHIDSTGGIGAFKLLSIAGAYWRGDEKRPMLTRIYGTAFNTKEELDSHLHKLEEAKKRDHRKLGPQLELFMFSDLVGPGLPLLLPKGQIIRAELEDYLIEKKKAYGHQFVWTPHIAKSELYMKSKDWQKYDAMMPPLKIEDSEYTLKPMNCPHHFQIYLSKTRSYRDLPLRLAENATVYRYEKSGEINGLLRVRALTQDDSHWFVAPDQIAAEIETALNLMEEVYNDMGLNDYSAEISIRDPKEPEKYLGDAKIWDQAEAQLEEVIKAKKIKYHVSEGEAAFYGPKIDLKAHDTLGRTWQLMTIQLDFNQPDNFDLTFTDQDGKEKKVAVLHIAILGSIERFLAILIENYGGAFPTWLSPEQVRVLPISDKHFDYANEINQKMVDNGIRSMVDDRSERLQYKIRDAEVNKVPYILVVGDKEAETHTVAVRVRGMNNQGLQKADDFIQYLIDEIMTRGKVAQATEAEVEPAKK